MGLSLDVPTPHGGGIMDEWNVTTVEMPSMSLGYAGEVSAGEMYSGSCQIPFPLEIGGRTFSDWNSFWAATGVGNIMYSCAVTNQLFLGIFGISIGNSNGEVNILQRDNQNFSGKTLYIFARFTD